MIFLLLGCLTLLVLMGALGAFSRAQVATIKSLGFWIAAIGGLALAAMLLLTGRGLLAMAALALLVPLLWSWLGEARRGVGDATRPRQGQGEGPRPSARSGGQSGGRQRGRTGRGDSVMTREEAYEVLGLAPSASRDDIIAAHRRLMRAAHPDAGGSDWLAARINRARDILLA